MKNYYAFSYAAGLAVTSTGERYGSFHAFPSRSLRDEFVANGGDFATSPDWRVSIHSKDSELRSALWRAGRLMENGAGKEHALYEVNIITN